MKQLLLYLFLLITSVSYGQTKVTMRGNSGGGTATAPTITASSATTLNLSTATNSAKTYEFTGSAATTWTLPARSSSSTWPIHIKNNGTANITLQRAGSDQLYLTSAINSITIFPGDAITVQNGSAYWNIQ